MEKNINKEIENRLKKNNFCKLSEIEKFLSNQNMKNLIFQEAVKFTSQGFMLLGYVVYEQNQKIVCNYAYSNKIEELLTTSLNQNQKIIIKQVQLLALHSGDISMNEAVNILCSNSQSLIVKKPTTIQVLPPYALDSNYFQKQKQAKKQKQANKGQNTKPQEKKKQKQGQNPKAQEKKKEKEIKKEEELPRIKSKTQKYVEPVSKVQQAQKPFTQVSKPKEVQIKKQEQKRKLQIQSDQDQYNPQEFMKAFGNDTKQKKQYKPEKMQIEEQMEKIQIKQQKEDTSGDSGKKTADIQSKSDSDGDDLMQMMKVKKKTEEEQKKVQSKTPMSNSKAPINNSKTQNQLKTQKQVGTKPKQVSLASMWSKPKV